MTAETRAETGNLQEPAINLQPAISNLHAPPTPFRGGRAVAGSRVSGTHAASTDQLLFAEALVEVADLIRSGRRIGNADSYARAIVANERSRLEQQLADRRTPRPTPTVVDEPAVVIDDSDRERAAAGELVAAWQTMRRNR